MLLMAGLIDFHWKGRDCEQAQIDHTEEYIVIR